MPPHDIQLSDFQAFVCTGCGLCCTRPWDVRIEPEVEAEIRSSQLVRQRQKEGYVPLGVSEGKVVAQRQRNGDCMFLDEDVLCGLHKELGGLSKPVGCQLYPYHATRTPSGTFFSLSFACPPAVAGFDRDVHANRAELQAILDKFPDAVEDFSEDNDGRVQVAQGRKISWESYLQLEQRLLQGFNATRPVDSLLELAIGVLLSNPNQEDGSWPELGAPSTVDAQSLSDLLNIYGPAIVSIIENEHDHAARADFGQGLEAGQRMPSRFFAGSLPAWDLDRPLPAWALQTYLRYYFNAVVGKAVLRPTVVTRLLAMSVGFLLLSFYVEGFRQARAEDEVSLETLTLAFEVVEAEVVSHSTTLTSFFENFETTLTKFLFL